MTSSKVRRVAYEILIDLVFSLEPRLMPLRPWTDTVYSTIDKWYTSEGNQGVKRAKSCLEQGWLAILGEDVTQLSYTKSEDKIPLFVKPLVDRVSSLKLDPRLLSATLTLVRVTDLWLGNLQDSTVQDSLRTIQTSKLPPQAKEVIEEFKLFVPNFLATYPDSGLTKAWNSALHLSSKDFVHYTEHGGPNGPLTANAHKDVKTLMEAATLDGSCLYSKIEELQTLICEETHQGIKESMSTVFESVSSWSKYDEMKVSSSPGRINYVLEKAGKVRLVASPDYFSQVSLKPLHNWAFNCLKAIGPDCTFDQKKAIPIIQEWHQQGRYVASFDQSSCTDLFPFEAQLSLISERFGQPIAESVKTVMSDRDWEVKLPKSGLTKKIRWSIGQPMGLMLSWPLMALTHHFLVQFSYWRSSGKTFAKKGPYNNYVICGDDIVIADKAVADSYRSIVTKLGMRINASKSHVSGGKTNITPISEFAKIQVWNGKPLFPIRPNMVLSSLRDFRVAPLLLLDLANISGFSMKFKSMRRFIQKHFPKGKRFLMSLLTIPRDLGGIGYRDSTSIKKNFTSIDDREIHPWLYYLGQKIRSQLLLEQKSLDLERLPEMDSDIYRKLPLFEYAQAYESEHPAFSRIRYTVPSVEEICYTICTEGLRPYKYLLDNNDGDHVVPPSWSLEAEQAAIKQAGDWEKALRKKHYFTNQHYLSLIHGFDKVGSSLMFLGTLQSILEGEAFHYGTPEDVKLCQYSIIASHLKSVEVINSLA